MKKVPMITTERLRLSAIEDRDKEDMIALLTNEAIGKTFMVPDFKSHKEAVKLFEVLKRLSESEERFVYGIYLENKLIGFINDVDCNETEVELGYVIHPEHKNKGYATEVLSTCINQILSLGYFVVKAGAFEENLASMRVMEKCGMTRMLEEDSIEYRGKVHRCIYYKKEK